MQGGSAHLPEALRKRAMPESTSDRGSKPVMVFPNLDAANISLSR
jgi:phosphotransacetylase